MFIVNIFCFVLIDIFTVKPNSHAGSSGNGNIGLIFDIIAIPFYLLFLFQIIVSVSPIIKSQLVTKPKNLITILLLVIILVGLILLQFYYYHSEIIKFGGDNTNPNSLIYNFDLINQYTNILFFNSYTFLIGIVISILLTVLFHFSKKK